MHHFISFILRIAYACFFGFIMLWHTNEIVKYIPQLLGALLMLESISQVLELFYLKIRTHVSWGFFIIPVVILLFGLWLFFECHLEIENFDKINTVDAMAKLKIQMKVVGVCFILFILSEILISLVFFKPMYMPKKFAEEKAKQKEAERALAAEQARQAQLAAEREREIAAEQARQAAEEAKKVEQGPTSTGV
jgi:hypothetical protein